MKKLFINSTLLIILIGLPLVPNYLYLYYSIVKSNLTIDAKDDSSNDTKILTGDIAYLQAIMLRANKNESNDNGDPISQRTSSSVIQLDYTAPLKIEVFTSLIINKESLSFVNNNLTTVYLKIPSPPPKNFS